MSELKNLGYSNRWSKLPIEITKCSDLKHDIYRKEIKRCVTEYTCEICGYFYKEDST